MAFGEHRDERLRGRHGRLPASIDGIHVPVPDEMRQVQVGQVAVRRAVNRVILRPDEDSELRGDAGVRRELAELRGRSIASRRAKYYIPLPGWAACGRDGLAWLC